MEKLKKGIFITFEGPEGSGKSTHAGRIYNWLRDKGFDCVIAREPGGTFVGEAIRGVLLNTLEERISPLTELMLFETARSQIIDEVIIPALENRKIVIMDRFNDSTIVYQGYAGTLPIEQVKKIDKLVTKSVKKDITILLDVDAKLGLDRALTAGKKDRMEKRDLDFHNAVRRGFLNVAKEDPKRVRVIRTDRDMETVYKSIMTEIKRVVKRNLKEDYDF